MKNTGITLLSPKEFVQDVNTQLEKKPFSVKFIFFRIRHDKMMVSLLPSLINALHSGTRVTIHADTIYSQHQPYASFFPARYGPKRKLEIEKKKTSLEMLTQLVSLGADLQFINKPSFINKHLFPVMGRDHRKLLFIRTKDKDLAYFGATNFEEGEQNDYMVKVTDELLVRVMEDISKYSDTMLPVQDLKFEENNVTFLLDRGKPGSSIIWEHARAMIKDATKKISFTSQLPPEPQLMKEFIKASKRGVKIEVILSNESHPKMANFPYSLTLRKARNEAKKYGIDIINSRKSIIHAKILRVDDSVLVGSHNLSYVGVLCGTVELNAQIKDKDFLKQIEAFIENLK